MYDLFRTIDDPSGLTATTIMRPGGVRVVTLVGDIDAATVEALDDALATGDRLVVDLTRVAFLSCAGVRSLLQANERAVVAVVPAGHSVTRSLEVTGADQVLEIHHNVATAVTELTERVAHGREA